MVDPREKVGGRVARWRTHLGDVPPGAAAALAAFADADVRAEVAKSTDDVDVLDRLCGAPERPVRLAVAANPALSVTAQRTLAADRDPAVLAALASNSALSVDMFPSLDALGIASVSALLSISPAWIRDPDVLLSPGSRMGGLAATSDNPDTLDTLATHDEWLVRAAAAANGHLRTRTLRRLANDPEPLVRVGVAKNPNCPAPFLDEIARDPTDQKAHYHVAKHPATWKSTLEHLARSDWAVVRAAAASNPYLTSHAVLVALSDDPDPQVRRSLVSGSYFRPTDIVARLAGDTCDSVREAVAAYECCPAMTLARLAGDTVEVRRLVAENERCPSKVLTTLAGDSDIAVKGSIAKHRYATPAALDALACSEHWHIRAAVAANPATPEATILSLLGNGASEAREVREAIAQRPTATPLMLRHAADDLDVGVLIALAGNESTPTLTLDALAAGDDEDVRVAAAQNPSTSPDALARLTSDENANVRFAAAANRLTPADSLRRVESSDDDPYIRAAAIITLATPAPAHDLDL